MATARVGVIVLRGGRPVVDAYGLAVVFKDRLHAEQVLGGVGSPDEVVWLVRSATRKKG